MAYETQAYVNRGGDPVVVVVTTGTHDVSRLVNLFAGGLCEHMPIRDHLVRQLRRRNRGRDALRLLAAHGGPDLLTPPREGGIVEFVQLVEVNDHEGETWSFWLQINGNEVELEKLRNLMAATDLRGEDGDEQYVLSTGRALVESEVDLLVEYAEDGYMASHNKVVGTLTCPEELGEYGDRLYKGGVRDFFAVAQ